MKYAIEANPPLPLFPSRHGLLPPKLDNRVLVSVLLTIAEGKSKAVCHHFSRL